MPISKIKNHGISLISATLVGFVVLCGVTFANDIVDTVDSPFEFHDLETDRDIITQFSKLTPDLADTGPLQRLEYAAEEGSELAMWKLGRIYSKSPEGDKKHLRAFEMFSKVVGLQSDHSPYSERAPFISSALVSLGRYYRTGIPDSYVRKNRDQAWSMFFTAATYYGDPRAQYALFDMCDGGGFDECSQVQAGRWLKRSAQNGDVTGQAKFGFMQFEGVNGVRRDPVQGLKWLTIARERAHSAQHAWVQKLHEQAFSVATEADRSKAGSLAEQWMRKYCKDVTTC